MTDLQAAIESAQLEWKEDESKARDEKQVIEKYGKLFHPSNIDNITREDFKSFLNFKNNKHWNALERQGPEITRDMDKFKKTLKLLLDESIPIEQRLKRIRDGKSSPEYHKGFGTAYYTPILLLVYPTKYPVVNNIVKDALQETGIYPNYESKDEWIAYSEVCPKILKLAQENNLSLWQMDWVWWNLAEVLSYDKLYKFITTKMDAKTNYQPTMIKTLLEKGTASKEEIDQKIRDKNPEKGDNFVSKEVYETLVSKHHIIIQEGNNYRLNLAEELTDEQKKELIELIDNEYFLLDGLSKKGVSEAHISILKKFHKKRGKYLQASEIYGEKKPGDLKKLPLAADDIVNEPHYMHNLITGVFTPSGDEYALSIQLSPKSKWALEIDRTHPTLRINYDFGSYENYKSQITKLDNCFKNSVPVGIIFKTLKAKNKILGLGKVTAHEGSKFIIESFGISEDESKILKDETIREFDNSLRDPDILKIEEINYPELFSTVNFENDRFKTDLIEIDESKFVPIYKIIEYCGSAEWVIPKFQRYFDWNKEQIKDFLESIFREYYVGSLLLWEVKKELDVNLGVMPIKYSETRIENLKRNSITAIVLDGQQRITSLYYAIKAPHVNFGEEMNEKLSYFYINFGEYFKSDTTEDLIRVYNEEIDEQESFQKMLFPLYKLENYEDWTRNFRDYLRTNKELDIEKIITLIDKISIRLRYIYRQYKIPYVVIPAEMTIDQVTDIFVKINITGKPLGIFDILIARLSKNEIELRNLWEVSKKRYLKFKNYFERTKAIKGLYILQSMALCYSQSKSCKRKDILDIYKNIACKNKEDFEEKWDKMSDYVAMAIESLEDTKDGGFGSTTRDYLPFEPMIPVLAALYQEIDTIFRDDKKNCLRKLENWYWTSVFTNSYSSSVDTEKTSDYNDLISWFSTEAKIPKKIEKFRELLSPQQLDLVEVQQKTSAKFRGVLSLIALKNVRDLDTGKPIFDNIGKMKSDYDVDHIFPKSKYSDNVESILNRTWLSKETNERIKRAKEPSEFIKETIEKKYNGNEQEFIKTLETHLISHDAYLRMKENDFEGFIKEREKLIVEYIGKKIGAELETPLPTMTTPDTEYTNVRILGRHIEKCKDYLNWIDKYFSIAALDALMDAYNKTNLKEIKILVGIEKADEKLRSYFERSANDLSKKGIRCEMRVIINKNIGSVIHDRWIISRNIAYNLMSGDIARRGQFAEIKETKNADKLPFAEWWEKSLDILTRWNEIQSVKNKK